MSVLNPQTMNRTALQTDIIPGKVILYFDLENTLINHWTDQRLCWIEQNKNILKESAPAKIGIFSFALWCDENINTFINNGMKAMIENEYNVAIAEDEIIHVNDMIKAYNDVNVEASHPNGTNKTEYFLSWVTVNQNRLDDYNNIWLVDDTVDPEKDSTIFLTSSVNIHLRNPVVYFS